eukprot:CAMPEP_0113903588 /NCGR_PEP_ID=MMETSP0780_2-20120614/22640_1 /TAXON_ID=652834 /ORGANISM="Palpitomonas bilix" /LENGTH=897 /DNA_ID=CAMNT_0000896823 /DNA_START=732 /DNA_END=3425 /DNA_ORIENTATION=+ /assembly_acc=CAM_ASM_000599
MERVCVSEPEVHPPPPTWKQIFPSSSTFLRQCLSVLYIGVSVTCVVCVTLFWSWINREEANVPWNRTKQKEEWAREHQVVAMKRRFGLEENWTPNRKTLVFCKERNCFACKSATQDLDLLLKIFHHFYSYPTQLNHPCASSSHLQGATGSDSPPEQPQASPEVHPVPRAPPSPWGHTCTSVLVKDREHPSESLYVTEFIDDPQDEDRLDMRKTTIPQLAYRGMDWSHGWRFVNSLRTLCTCGPLYASCAPHFGIFSAAKRYTSWQKESQAYRLEFSASQFVQRVTQMRDLFGERLKQVQRQEEQLDKKTNAETFRAIDAHLQNLVRESASPSPSDEEWQEMAAQARSFVEEKKPGFLGNMKAKGALWERKLQLFVDIFQHLLQNAPELVALLEVVLRHEFGLLASSMLCQCMQDAPSQGPSEFLSPLVLHPVFDDQAMKDQTFYFKDSHRIRVESNSALHLLRQFGVDLSPSPPSPPVFPSRNKDEKVPTGNGGRGGTKEAEASAPRQEPRTPHKKSSKRVRWEDEADEANETDKETNNERDRANPLRPPSSSSDPSGGTSLPLQKRELEILSFVRGTLYGSRTMVCTIAQHRLLASPFDFQRPNMYNTETVEGLAPMFLNNNSKNVWESYHRAFFSSHSVSASVLQSLPEGLLACKSVGLMEEAVKWLLDNLVSLSGAMQAHANVVSVVQSSYQSDVGKEREVLYSERHLASPSVSPSDASRPRPSLLSRFRSFLWDRPTNSSDSSAKEHFSSQGNETVLSSVPYPPIVMVPWPSSTTLRFFPVLIRCKEVVGSTLTDRRRLTLPSLSQTGTTSPGTDPNTNSDTNASHDAKDAQDDKDREKTNNHSSSFSSKDEDRSPEAVLASMGPGVFLQIFSHMRDWKQKLPSSQGTRKGVL